MISENKKSLVAAISILMILIAAVPMVPIGQAGRDEKTLLNDNFEHGKSEWRLQTAGIGEPGGVGGVAPGGTWTVIDDGTGNKVFEARSADGIRGTAAFAGKADWTDYTIEARTQTTDSYMGLIVHADSLGKTYYSCYLSPNNPYALVEIFKHTNGIWGREGLIGSNVQPPNVYANSWICLKVKVSNTALGTLIQVFYKNEGSGEEYPAIPQLEFLDINSPYTSGKVGLIFYDVHDGNEHYEWFDDVVVTEPAKVVNVIEGESIQAAVDRVIAGGKVIVHKGTYYQSFAVNKPMTIQGEGATLDCRSLASFRAAIDVVSSGVTISGFTIYTPKIAFTAAIWFGRGAGAPPIVGGLVENNIIYCEFTAIFLMGSSIDIRNNVITAVYPIVLYNGRNINIKHNKLTAVPTDLETNGMPSGVGIQFYGAPSSGTIENNVIDATTNGIETREDGSPIDVEIVNNEIDAGNNGIQFQIPSGLASNIVIVNNKIYAEGDGINLNNMGMTNPVITKNVVYSDNTGIYLSSISEATVKHNEVHINEAKPGYPTGILISGGTSNQVAKNIVTGDFITGIFLAGSNLNTIDKNVITGVYRYDPNYLDAGIRLWDANDNTGTKNLITGVRLPIEDQGDGNIFTP